MVGYLENIYQNYKKPSVVIMSWGAEKWTANANKWLRFKSNGYKHKGHVYIILAWNDTFTVVYTTLKGKVKFIDEEVYIDMLVESIDNRIERNFVQI